jgi:hypothetical protein
MHHYKVDMPVKQRVGGGVGQRCVVGAKLAGQGLIRFSEVAYRKFPMKYTILK